MSDELRVTSDEWEEVEAYDGVRVGDLMFCPVTDSKSHRPFIGVESVTKMTIKRLPSGIVRRRVYAELVNYNRDGEKTIRRSGEEAKRLKSLEYALVQATYSLLLGIFFGGHFGEYPDFHGTSDIEAVEDLKRGLDFIIETYKEAECYSLKKKRGEDAP